MHHIQYAVRMQIKSWFTVLRCGKRVMVRRKDDELTGHAFRRPYIDAVCREAGNAEFQFMRPPHVTTKHNSRDSLYRTRRDALCDQPSRPSTATSLSLSRRALAKQCIRVQFIQRLITSFASDIISEFKTRPHLLGGKCTSECIYFQGLISWFFFLMESSLARRIAHVNS